MTEMRPAAAAQDWTHREIGGRRIRWSPAMAAQAYANGSWVRETLAERLLAAAAHSPERILVEDDVRALDCRTLAAEAGALAHWLRARAPEGSVVSYMLPNWHEAVVVYLAATLAGMVVNPILPSLRDRELAFILEDVDARFLFVPAQYRRQDYVAMLDRMSGSLARPPLGVVLRGEAGAHVPFEQARLDADAELPPPDPDAVRMVLYTSGTTGRPKGVLHTHNSIHALLCQIGDHWHVAPGDLMLVASPIGHITGSFCAIECPLLLGATARLMDRWAPDEAVQLIDRLGCTHMVGATPFLEGLLAAARDADTRLASLKLFACGGASVPPSLVHEAAGYFARAVVTRVYGSTELPLITIGATRADETRQAAETDGRADRAQVELVPHAAARSGEGEIVASGPQMLVGYQNPDDEADAFDSAGRFRTGDVARWVDGRYLLVTGRAKDIIIRSGENIAPKEIEDLLVEHPGIAEVAIVGLPDTRTGERACAVIVPRAGRQGELDVAGLRRFLDHRGVAVFKVPEQVELWDALPKNDAGKVLKHRVREQLLA